MIQDEIIKQNRTLVLKEFFQLLKKEEDGRYCFNPKEIDTNEKIKEYVDLNQWLLVKVFHHHNWANVRNSKKRLSNTLKRILKISGITLNKEGDCYSFKYDL